MKHKQWSGNTWMGLESIHKKAGGKQWIGGQKRGGEGKGLAWPQARRWKHKGQHQGWWGWVKSNLLVNEAHIFKLNLHILKIMIVESFHWNFTNWGAVVFEKWVLKTNNFLSQFQHVKTY